MLRTISRVAAGFALVCSLNIHVAQAAPLDKAIHSADWDADSGAEGFAPPPIPPQMLPKPPPICIETSGKIEATRFGTTCLDALKKTINQLGTSCGGDLSNVDCSVCAQGSEAGTNPPVYLPNVFAFTCTATCTVSCQIPVGPKKSKGSVDKSE